MMMMMMMMRTKTTNLFIYLTTKPRIQNLDMTYLYHEIHCERQIQIIHFVRRLLIPQFINWIWKLIFGYLHDKETKVIGHMKLAETFSLTISMENTDGSDIFPNSYNHHITIRKYIVSGMTYI